MEIENIAIDELGLDEEIVKKLKSKGCIYTAYQLSEKTKEDLQRLEFDLEQIIAIDAALLKRIKYRIGIRRKY